MAFKTQLHSFCLFIVKMFQDNLDSVNSHSGKRAKGLIRMFARDPGIIHSKQSLDQTARTSHEIATAVNTHCYWIGKGNAADANVSSGTSDKASRFSKFIPEVTVTHALPASHAAGSRPRDNSARPRACRSHCARPPPSCSNAEPAAAQEAVSHSDKADPNPSSYSLRHQPPYPDGLSFSCVSNNHRSCWPYGKPALPQSKGSSNSHHSLAISSANKRDGTGLFATGRRRDCPFWKYCYLKITWDTIYCTLEQTHPPTHTNPTHNTHRNNKTETTEKPPP